MNSKAGKLLVVESDDALRDQIVAVLNDAGYAVSTDYREGIKAVLAFDPVAVIMGADPPQLDCCDSLSEIKGAEHTQNIRGRGAIAGRIRRAYTGPRSGRRRCSLTALRLTRLVIEGAHCPHSDAGHRAV